MHPNKAHAFIEMITPAKQFKDALKPALHKVEKGEKESMSWSDVYYKQVKEEEQTLRRMKSAM